jgi:hypothetical protein
MIEIICVDFSICFLTLFIYMHNVQTIETGRSPQTCTGSQNGRSPIEVFYRCLFTACNRASPTSMWYGGRSRWTPNVVGELVRLRTGHDLHKDSINRTPPNMYFGMLTSHVEALGVHVYLSHGFHSDFISCLFSLWRGYAGKGGKVVFGWLQHRAEVSLLSSVI